MILIDEKSGEKIKMGARLKNGNGESCKLIWIQEPDACERQGRLGVKYEFNQSGLTFYFPDQLGLKFIEVENE